jgi:hypothetical protein
MRTRKLLGAGALLLVLLAAAYSIWWWWAAGTVERGILAWMEERRAEGALVEHQGLSVGGFPFALRATVEAPHLAMRGMEWQGTRLVAEAPPWDYRRVALALPGEHRLTLIQPGQLPLVLLARGGGQGHTLLTLAGQPLELRLTFADLIAQPEVAPTAIAALELTASRPSTPPASHTETGLTLALSATEVILPEGTPAVLGQTIRQAGAALRVQGTPPGLEPASLSAWSRDGGTVEVDRLALDWGPATVTMQGTLALDAELQPQAAMSAELSGTDALLTALQPQLRPNQVAMARTVVTMLARPDANGRPVIQAPVTVQNGALFLGPLKLLPMPRIDW